MSEKELKKVLADSLQREAELYDFCIECLKKIYGEEATRPIQIFDEGIDFADYNGCIQPLSCIEGQYKKEIENRKATL
jgi:hypothetical protein